MRVLSFLVAFIALNASEQVMTQQNILQGVVPLNPDAIELNKIILDQVIF